MNYRSAAKEVCYTQLAGKALHVYTRFSTLGWVHKSKSLFGRAVQFVQLEVQRVREKDCVFTQLLQSTITNFVDLDDLLALVAPPTKDSPTTRLDPSLLYAQLPHDYEGFVVSFDGSAKTENNCSYGRCSWMVTNSLKRGVGKQTDILPWRREINRQQQIALDMTKEYQAAEKARRARIHNEKLNGKEHAAIPKSVNNDSPATTRNRSLYFDLEAEFGSIRSE
ncbi:hypothetical protein PHMEG_00029030 [Phytophthora megakarya]|uniref:Uncharacterized protein n=1 Tax=Phytophthora megakarya TaxID=4795 RepID=A0A225V644_9STRA|nr:hypothetical protein PHMEG_00029030 [Phytophthora megakarya]